MKRQGEDELPKEEVGMLDRGILYAVLKTRLSLNLGTQPAGIVHIIHVQ